MAQVEYTDSDIYNLQNSRYNSHINRQVCLYQKMSHLGSLRREQGLVHLWVIQKELLLDFPLVL